MITPEALKSGDKIGIVSTARKISREELQPAISILQDWGFKVVTGKNLFKRHHQYAGTDEERLADLQNYIDDPSVKAIICARGGYGTIRIVDHLNTESLKRNPKWIIGYSDVTVLLNRLYNEGLESLHATMPINFDTNSASALQSLRSVITGKPVSYEINSHSLNVKGSSKGLLTGGNLSVLYSQLGSTTSMNTKGCVLFLEDLDEYLYHIDRMIQNLKRNAYFDNIKGLIVGGMTDMNDNDIPFGKTAEEIIWEAVEGFNFPVSFGFPAGHISNNCSLIFGREVTFEVADTVKLSFSHV